MEMIDPSLCTNAAGFSIVANGFIDLIKLLLVFTMDKRVQPD